MKNPKRDLYQFFCNTTMHKIQQYVTVAMVLREANLETFDGYNSPIPTEFEYEYNYLFFIEGYSLQIGKGFFIWERGEGDTFTEALDDAYNKIFYRLILKYHIYSNSMKMNECMQLEGNDKRKGTGFGFYTMDEVTIEEFREEEERLNMAREDEKIDGNGYVDALNKNEG
jgi:hypothetical protein